VGRVLLALLELDPAGCRRALASPSALAVLVGQLRCLQDAEAGELIVRALADVGSAYSQSVLASGGLEACLAVIDFCSAATRATVYRLAFTCGEGIVTRGA